MEMLELPVIFPPFVRDVLTMTFPLVFLASLAVITVPWQYSRQISDLDMSRWDTRKHCSVIPQIAIEGT